MTSIKQSINNSISKAQRVNNKDNSTRKTRMLGQLKDNLSKGETVKDNQGLIERYTHSKPKELNQMQQAFAALT